MRIALAPIQNAKAVSAVVLFLASLAAPPAPADVLEDFKQASARSGCESIPYTDERRNCHANSEQVEDYCKRDIVRCDRLLKERLLNSLKKAEAEVARVELTKQKVATKLGNTKVEGEKRKYESEIARFDREITGNQETVNGLRREFDDFDDRNHIAVGLQRAKSCLTSRSVVQEIFDLNADRILDQTLGSKATTAEKAELKSHATAIIEKMKPEWKVHETAITETHARIANCQKVIDLKHD